MFLLFRRVLLLGMFFTIINSCLAQSDIKPEMAVKIFLHLDKDIYIPGETVFFKAYLFNNGSFYEGKNNLYLDIALYNGKVIQQLAFPVYEGSVSGSIDLPNEDSLDVLFIRAYTSEHVSENSVSPYIRPIFIVRNNGKLTTKKRATEDIQFHIFPEGGALTAGVLNTVAFEAIYSNGNPAVVRGLLTNKKGDSILLLSQVHAGMGKFKFTPERGEEYFIDWYGDQTKNRTALPAPAHDNVNLHIEQLPGKLFYILSTQSSAKNFETLYLTLSSQGVEAYKHKLDFNGKYFLSGMINTSKIIPGIITINLSDENGIPIAERIVFVNQAEVLKPVSVSVKGDLSARSKHTIEVRITDSSFTNMSISVFDEAFSDAPPSTIASDVLLNQELRGAVYKPDYYFSDTTKEVKENLDLLMLTHKGRRFRQIQGGRDSIDNYITIEGSIKALKKNLEVPEQVVLIIKEKNKSNTIFPLKVNSNGEFKATGLFFSDSAIVYCNIGKNATESQNYEVKLKGGMQPDNVDSMHVDLKGLFFSENSNKQISQEYMPTNTTGKVLKEVVIKTRKLTRHEELEQRYTSGFFRNGTNTVDLNVIDDSLAWTKLDIINYIGYRVPGLCAGYDVEGKYLGVRSNTGCSKGSLLIFINESLSDNDVLRGVSIESVAYVKYIRTYFGTRDDHGNFSPAIAIYLKKEDDLFSNQLPSAHFFTRTLKGYSVVKEFYSPDYSSFSPAKDYHDTRPTLLWQSNVLLGGSTTKIEIPFYNNDISKKLKLVLQGVDESGRFIYKEKIIQ